MLKPVKQFMDEAIALAKTAQANGDYAIGAVVVRDGKIIASSDNRSKQDQNPAAHAEVLAITHAAAKTGNRHLTGCVLYTTHEPCPMCASLCVFAKIEAIVYGARIEDMSNYRSHSANDKYLWRTIDISCEEVIARSPEPIQVVGDFRRQECCELFNNA